MNTVMSAADIELKIKVLQDEVAALLRQKEIAEFTADPEAFKAKLLAKPTVNDADNAFRKTKGTIHSGEDVAMSVFYDYPTDLFNAGTMLSKMVDRGWLTRSRSPGTVVHAIFAVLLKSGKITRPDRGVYRKA